MKLVLSPLWGCSNELRAKSAFATLVIPGRASWCGPGIHTPCGGYGFRARSLSDKIDFVNFAQSSRPGMTEPDCQRPFFLIGNHAAIHFEEPT
jgi:hypothetical protein